MHTDTCELCRYFHQHYTLLRPEHFLRCDCGHCHYPRVKTRKPETAACKHFEPLAP